MILIFAIGGAVAVMTNGGGTASASTQSDGGAAKPAPEGFTGGSVKPITFAMPDGTKMDPPPSCPKAKVVESAETGATYFVGVDKYEFLNPSVEQLSLRAGRMMMSDVYGQKPTTRSGLDGFSGQSAAGLELTNMQVEYYLANGKVLVIACGMPIKREKWKPSFYGEEPPPPKPPTEEELQKAALFKTESQTFFDSVTFSI